MADLRSLYQEVILDHNKSPRNFRKMADATRTVEGYNPLCGDRYTFYVRLDGDRITEVTFEGSGCAISKASASIMTAAIKGKSKSDVQDLFEKFHKLVTEGMNKTGGLDGLGKLAVFSGVSEFPVRVKCATLSWHAVRAALQSKEEVVSTE